MSFSWKQIQRIKERRATEVGPDLVLGSRRVALAYPSPYQVGMSSLGFQWVYRQLFERGLAVERCFLPDDVEGYRQHSLAPFSYETQTPLSDFPLIAVSLAYELELSGLITLLQLAGIPPLRKDRDERHPLVLLGGPLTFSNPLPAAPFVDAMLLGEADDTVGDAVESLFDSQSRQHWLDGIERLAGGYVPARMGQRLPPVAKASSQSLPARSVFLAPQTALSNMFLIEGERGCHRSCSFCVMRRSTNGGMRLVEPDSILSLIPQHAGRVGLVGAAISDHPKLVDLLATLVEQGRGVSVSSLRADRVALKPDIARFLKQSGARTLTVASDAASQRLRREISKGTVERHLIACAKIAAEQRFEVLKIYMMVGLPGECDEDIDELIRFTLELAGHGRIALGIAPFVAKRMTPLDGTPFAGIKEVERRLKRIKKGLRGKADVRPTSARWAWVEYQLAQGGADAGLAVLQAVRAGGRFQHYKAAFKALGAPSRPWATDEGQERPS